MSARAEDAGLDMVRVYVWEWPVRVTHWVVFLSLMTLSVTGLYLGRPFLVVAGPAGDHFVTGWMRALHGYAAIFFTLAVLSRLAWMLLGNRWSTWRQFVPLTRERRRDTWETFRFYVFLRPGPPGVAGHNPLAALAYIAVYGLLLVQILTGFGLYARSAHVDSPMRMFAFLVPLLGGLQAMRWTHHVVMWLLLGFVVHHVYSAWLLSQLERTGTMESIFSGYKFLPRSLARSLGLLSEGGEERR